MTDVVTARPAAQPCRRCDSTTQIHEITPVSGGREHVVAKCGECGLRRAAYERGTSPKSKARWATRERREADMRELGMNLTEWMIYKAQEWDRLYGAPPTAYDWNLKAARDRAGEERLAQIEERHREQVWPSATTVQSIFGSWNNLMKRAGFDTLDPGVRRFGNHYHRRTKPNPEVAERREQTAELWNAGYSAAQIAEQVGVANTQTVYRDLSALKTAGEWLRPSRRKAAKG